MLAYRSAYRRSEGGVLGGEKHMCTVKSANFNQMFDPGVQLSCVSSLVFICSTWLSGLGLAFCYIWLVSFIPFIPFLPFLLLLGTKKGSLLLFVWLVCVLVLHDHNPEVPAPQGLVVSYVLLGQPYSYRVSQGAPVVEGLVCGLQFYSFAAREVQCEVLLGFSGCTTVIHRSLTCSPLTIIKSTVCMTGICSLLITARLLDHCAVLFVHDKFHYYF